MVDNIIGVLILLLFVIYGLKIYFHFCYLRSIKNIESSFSELLINPFRYYLYKFRLFFLFLFLENSNEAKSLEEKSDLFYARLFFYLMWFIILSIFVIIYFLKN
jgi:hypothetical protein